MKWRRAGDYVWTSPALDVAVAGIVGSILIVLLASAIHPLLDSGQVGTLAVFGLLFWVCVSVGFGEARRQTRVAVGAVAAKRLDLMLLGLCLLLATGFGASAFVSQQWLVASFSLVGSALSVSVILGPNRSAGPTSARRRTDDEVEWSEGRETREAAQTPSGAAADSRCLAILKALATAVSTLDDSTYRHSCRVAVLARGLGQSMGMSQSEIEDLEWAARLHDLGLLSLPRVVLKESETLSTTESEMVKKHSKLGADALISADPLLLRIGLTILNHHERWDGTGFPSGRAGADIPLSARMLAVVDAFEALTSERPYRAALATPHALEVIKGGAGNHFDPDVVAVLAALLEGGRGTVATAKSTEWAGDLTPESRSNARRMSAALAATPEYS